MAPNPFEEYASFLSEVALDGFLERVPPIDYAHDGTQPLLDSGVVFREQTVLVGIDHALPARRHILGVAAGKDADHQEFALVGAGSG